MPRTPPRVSPSWLLPLAAALLVTGVGAGGAVAIRATRASGEEAEATIETRRALDRTYARLSDAASVVRGYVITGDTAFLRPLPALRREVTGTAATLARRGAGDPAFAAGAARLRRLVDERLARLDSAIAMRRTVPAGGALPPEVAGQVQRAHVVMEAVRAEVAALDARALAQRDALRAADDARERRLLLLVLAATLAAALLAVAGAAGLSCAELGLGDVGADALWSAAAAVAVVVLAYTIVVLLPATRRALLDPRFRLPPGAALRTALVGVPLATVLLEQVAFRAVLWGVLAREYGAGWATGVSALLFGLWHVPPRARQLRGRWLAVLGTVVFTALAGVALAGLRHAGGGLLAPVALHWAANGLGVLASAWVWSRRG